MNYVTDDGMKKMVDKLIHLKYTVRKEAAERLDAARKLGDLRENGDYKAAREEITQIDQKIGELQQLISESQVIKKEDLGIDVVHILHTVKIKDHTRKRTVEYTIVSKEEADPTENKVSAESPIGKGLLGLKIGDRATIRVPAGDLEFEVLEISC